MTVTDADTSFKHWRRTVDGDGIVWLVLDKADSGSNTLSSEVLAELNAVVAALEKGEAPTGVVIKSGKPSGFILGADVTEFKALESAEQGTAAAARGQTIMNRIAALRCPTVAALRGFALGGGLELALACRYRVAVQGYERNLGLPEVQLGIHPGFGGTVRAVEIMGAPRALDLMLTGRSLSPIEAKTAGLVDRLVDADELDRAAAEMIRAKPAPTRAPWYLRLLSSGLLRPLVAKRTRDTVARKARREHYPAPYAIVDLWERHGARGEAAYRAEVESIGRLLVTATCKNLVRMFELRERLRNLAPKHASVDRVHVVGAGIMGGDIAGWCALREIDVGVQDRAMQYVEPALERAKALFGKRLKAPGTADAAYRRLEVDLEGKTVGRADIIIEAIIENVDAKRSLFSDLESNAKPQAVLATNTSSIRIEDIAAALRDPSRLVGIHFFNPVAQLPLVEVIRGGQTGNEAFERALSFVTQIGKVPLPCRSAPGFVVNRILTPYMLEALRAHEDGHELETIDAAAKNFGMPMGPIELADRVGLDVALHVAKILSEVLGSPPPKALEAMVEAGHVGAKAGRGFYRYENGKVQRKREYPRPDRQLEDRLILPLLNEAVACYDEGVVEDPDFVDAGVVFGTGFAPFTGGPINHARQLGFGNVRTRLEELARELGPRFAPHAGWQRLEAKA
jgi:3-hydroxyacyl-CoA dehydrogenase/enoyl-CoA hydratase/3-hydroxybutyryl-CoA epimerase